MLIPAVLAAQTSAADLTGVWIGAQYGDRMYIRSDSLVLVDTNTDREIDDASCRIFRYTIKQDVFTVFDAASGHSAELKLRIVSKDSLALTNPRGVVQQYKRWGQPLDEMIGAVTVKEVLYGSWYMVNSKRCTYSKEGRLSLKTSNRAEMGPADFIFKYNGKLVVRYGSETKTFMYKFKNGSLLIEVGDKFYPHYVLYRDYGKFRAVNIYGRLNLFMFR